MLDSFIPGTLAHQLVNFEARVRSITQHLKANKKDKSTLRGLSIILGKYRKVLRYCKRTQLNIYNELIKHLSIKI